MQPSLRVLTSLVLCASAPAWSATYTAYASASSGTVNVSGPTDEHVLTADMPVGVSSASTATEILPSGVSGGTANGYSNSLSSVGSGAIHLLASSSGNFVSTNGGAAIGSGASSASGYFSESFVVAAGCAACSAGSVGTMTFSIGAFGSAAGGGSYTSSTPDGGNGGWSGAASWGLQGGVYAGYVPGSTLATSVDISRGAAVSASQAGVGYDTTNGGGAGSQSYVIQFIFGQAIGVQLLGQAYSNAGAQFDYYASQDQNGGSHGAAAFAADLSHTMGWGGIAELRDADGNLVGDYSALGDGGTDFRLNAISAVPEPASTALLIAGMAVVALRSRRALRAA